MDKQIASLQAAITTYKGSTPEAIENFRQQFISKKGKVAALFSSLKNIAPTERKRFGQLLNKLRNTAQEKYTQLQEQEKTHRTASLSPSKDTTLPPPPNALGTHHPLAIMQQKIIHIFNHIGFGIEEGPEIEDDWHNFTALNFLPEHPAREMQDTFFLTSHTKNKKLLRTHTSSVQVRLMKSQSPPLRILAPGRVFRNEAISARTYCMFHQIEGLYIDKEVSFLDLKETIFYFVHTLFGEKTKTRFRPSFFPFTEPSAEVDISCMLCKATGCTVCKYTGWVEIGGAGMVDPKVLTNCDINPDTYNGFAFGMGIERIAMLYYQIPDVRLFTENDIRFLEQFSCC